MITNSQLATWVAATYHEGHPDQDLIEASLRPCPSGVGELRADILRPDPKTDLYAIAIRGTVDKGNWLANLDARLVPSTILTDDLEAGIYLPKVHAGFARASEQITPHIAKALPKGARVIITGHSLGAAIALFLAPRLEQAGFPVVKVVTFGCPRVGDINYRMAWHVRLGATRVWRHVYGPDPVCQLPTPLRGYLHIGELLWFSYQGEAMNAGPWMRFGNRLGAYWAAWRKPGADLIGYHDMGRYQRLLADQGATDKESLSVDVAGE